jgi:hypothetical protein
MSFRSVIPLGSGIGALSRTQKLIETTNAELEKRLRSEILPAETTLAFTLPAHPGDAP